MIRYITALVLLVLLLPACKKDAPSPDTANPFLIEAGTQPLVIAHRGGRRLWPENTMVAFNNAVAMGVDVLEMDVVLTKDSVLVTIHDATIDRTCDSSGNVSDFTFDELQQFNFGYEFQDSTGAYPYRNNPVRIPALKEVLASFPGMLINIEIKDPGERGKLAAEILEEEINQYHDPKKVVAYSFTDEVMKHFRSVNDEGIFTGISLGEGFAFYNAVLNNSVDTLNIEADLFAIPMSQGPFNFAVDSLVEAAHSRNKAVNYWTINDTSDMKLLIDLGADGLMTDYPDRMMQVLDELGY